MNTLTWRCVLCGVHSTMPHRPNCEGCGSSVAGHVLHHEYELVK